MAMFIRAKRVTDPLDDKVKARLRGDHIQPAASLYASSGSDHDPAEPSCFSGLVHAFFDCNDATAPASATLADDDDARGGDGESEDDSWNLTFTHEMVTVRDLLDPKGDPLRTRLLSDASNAADTLADMRSRSGYRRAVMATLREAGYNAGLCKVRWEKCGGLIPGSYEYIDVVVTTKEGVTERYVVDVNFAAEFEVARAMEGYQGVVASLPRVMVGMEEEVRQVVRLMAMAAGRSLKSRGLSVPPWRKRRYMLAKWLGPYRRTVNAVPSSAGAAVIGGKEVVCGAVVGFQEVTGAVVPGAVTVPSLLSI